MEVDAQGRQARSTRISRNSTNPLSIFNRRMSVCSSFHSPCCFISRTSLLHYIAYLSSLTPRIFSLSLSISFIYLPSNVSRETPPKHLRHLTSYTTHIPLTTYTQLLSTLTPLPPPPQPRQLSGRHGFSLVRKTGSFSCLNPPGCSALSGSLHSAFLSHFSPSLFPSPSLPRSSSSARARCTPAEILPLSGSHHLSVQFSVVSFSMQSLIPHVGRTSLIAVMSDTHVSIYVDSARLVSVEGYKSRQSSNSYAEYRTVRSNPCIDQRTLRILTMGGDVDWTGVVEMFCEEAM